MTDDLRKLTAELEELTDEVEAAGEPRPVVAEEIEIYSYGLVCCSVCVPAGMDRELVERRVNMALPTGIRSDWHISDEGFKGGEPNPVQCDDDSTKLHYLLNC